MTRDLSQATVHPEKVKPASAVSRWTMDDKDVESGTIKDTWGNNNGTINGANTGVNSPVGYKGEAFSFDGKDDNVNINGFPAYTSSFTCSMWIDILSPNDRSTEGIIKMSNNWWWQVVDNGDGTISFGTHNGSNYTSINTDVTSGWKHHVFIFDGEDIIIYTNSVEQERSSGSPPTRTTNNGDRIAEEPFNSNNFTGKIDEVRIYSEALTQQQVWKLYNIGRNANWGYTRS